MPTAGSEQQELTRRSLVKGLGAFGVGSLLASLTPEMASAQTEPITANPIVVVDLTTLDPARDLCEQLAERQPPPSQTEGERATLVLFGRGGTYELTNSQLLAGRYSSFLTLDDTRYILTKPFQAIEAFVGGTFEASGPLGYITTAINVTMVNPSPAEPPNSVAFISSAFLSTGDERATLISGCSIDGFGYGADLSSNSTIRDTTISNIAGGAFVRARGDNVVIENNRSRIGSPLLYPDVIGSHVIVSLNGTNHTIRDNHFVAEAAAWQSGITNGATGDMVAVKGTTDFRIENNIFENSGEYGIVISHGSQNGVITRNSIIRTDGCAIVVGVDDVLDDSGESTRARVANIEVTDNHILDCGLDRGNDLGRSRATPNNSVLWNYPNALAGIRITNADGIAIRRNTINQYRSSAIWVTSTFADKDARARSEVTNLDIDDTNSLQPFASATFDDTTWQALNELGDTEHAPWSGTSKLVDETGDVTDGSVYGIEASRVIGFKDPIRNPFETVLNAQEVRVSVTCLGGSGRVDVHLRNKSTDTMSTYLVTVGAIGPRVRELGPLEGGRVTVTGRPDGPIRVTVVRDDEELYEEVHRIACGAPG